MAEILGNELLIKALGRKGWREEGRACVLQCAAQTARGSDTTTRTGHYLRRRRFTPLANTHSHIRTHTHTLTLALSDMSVSRPDRRIT